MPRAAGAGFRAAAPTFSVIGAGTGIHPAPTVPVLVLAAFLQVALLPMAGCGPAPPTPAPATAAAAAARAVVLERVDHERLMATVAAHRGKVVVLDCWSTSCPPCVRDFPRLLALGRRFGDEVVCLSLSLDYEGIGAVADVEPRVRGFLESVGAGGIVNLLSSEDADELCRKLDLVGVPAVYVWKADGGLARRFDEDDAVRRLGRPFTYDDVESLVRSLLDR